MRVLLVEDDVVLGDGLKRGLELRGHAADWLTDGEAARSALRHDAFAAVILDLALPGCGGMTLLTQWREEGLTTPVLVLTASTENRQCVEALDAGADDYVVKPVDLDQVIARLHALNRRAEGRADNRIVCGTLQLDRAGGTAWLGEAPLDLSAFEFVILEALMSRAGRAVTRAQLDEMLYGWDAAPESNSVQVLIHKLRAKIGRERIVTIRGLGYRLAP